MCRQAAATSGVTSSQVRRPPLEGLGFEGLKCEVSTSLQVLCPRNPSCPGGWEGGGRNNQRLATRPVKSPLRH